MLTIVCLSCTQNTGTEKYQKRRDQVINVHNRIKGIAIEDVFIGDYSRIQIIEDYLFIIDFKSATEFIRIIDKNSFKHVRSTALKGQGPGEIVRIGYITEDNVNRKFYVTDHGKNKIFSYDLDSVIANTEYLHVEKMKMGDQIFPTEYVYINDTLSIGVAIQRIGNGNFNPIVGKFNLETGDIKLMDYTINPNVKKKRICFDLSIEHGLYVECYMPHDLMTICNLDGDLKYNIYGPNWDTETHGTDHYGPVLFCGNRIVALYSGDKSFTEDIRPIHPTKFRVFDLEGNYLQTLEAEYPIMDFCYDKDNHRIIMSIDDDTQFAYFDLDGVMV